MATTPAPHPRPSPRGTAAFAGWFGGFGIYLKAAGLLTNAHDWASPYLYLFWALFIGFLLTAVIGLVRCLRRWGRAAAAAVAEGEGGRRSG